jgi:hypothetical protein
MNKTGLVDAAPKLALAVLAAALLTFGLGATPASGSAVPPWEPDPSSVGGLIFFNSSGQEVTGGSVDSSPLAAYVEGTATVRAGDTVATLYGYLPVKGEQPSAWSGEQLGDTTAFPNPGAPAPLGTSTLPVETGNSGDETLAQLEIDYPNKDTSDDGYAGMYELRLYTNAPHQSQTTTYDSADILISGSTWSVVYPAPPSLTSATPDKLAVSATGKVTFDGTGFESGATVTITGPSTAVTAVATSVVVTSTTLSATLKAGSGAKTGAYTVRITNPNGSSATCATCLNVTAAPTLKGISPGSAATGSSTAVTLTGTGFVSGAKVTGPKGVTFSKVKVVHPTTLTATMTVTSTAKKGTDEDVTVANDAAAGYGKATGGVLTIT